MADSVYTFKTKIRRKLHISFAHDAEFYLVFGGRRLNDHNDLHSHNIASSSTVFMIMRLRGGGKQDPCCKKEQNQNQSLLDLVLILFKIK